MGLVLWIDQDELATGLFARVFKERGMEFYTLNSVSYFSYLISDLNPSLIVIDSATALKDLEVFKKQYEDTRGFQNKPVVLVNPESALEFISNTVGIIKRPIDPFGLPEKLSKLIIKE